MLVITLKKEQSMDITGPARIKFLGWGRGGIRLGIEAHESVKILRTCLNSPQQQTDMRTMITTGQSVEPAPLCLLPPRK